MKEKEMKKKEMKEKEMKEKEMKETEKEQDEQDEDEDILMCPLVRDICIKGGCAWWLPDMHEREDSVYQDCGCCAIRIIAIGF